MKLFKTRRKVAVIALSVGLIAGIGGAAFAYFTSNGTGTGGATVGTAGSLTITEAGAVYNSLSASNTYHQDQCFACASISELGNEITLSSAGRLANVVVPFRNWDAAVTGVQRLRAVEPLRGVGDGDDPGQPGRGAVERTALVDQRDLRLHEPERVDPVDRRLQDRLRQLGSRQRCERGVVAFGLLRWRLA